MVRWGMTGLMALIAVPGLGSTFLATWIQKDNLNRKRGEHANAVVNGKIYMMGGIHDHTSGPAQVEVYDPAADTWTDVSSLPFSRHHFTAGAAVNGTEIWVCGGKNGGGNTGVKRVDVYNAATNTWRRGPDLPEIHWGGPSVVLNGKLHVLTGAQGNTVTTDHHFVLDLSNEGAGWSNAAKVPRPRVHVAGVALNGKIYVIGGEYHHNHDGDTTTMQVYNPANDTWDLSRAPLPLPRSHSEWATFTHDGKIWSVSGVDSSKSPRGQAEIFRYDPATNQWTELDPLPGKLVSPGAKIVNNTLYVFGGGVDDWFSGTMRTTWAWTLSAPPSPPAAPAGLTATTVSESRINLSWTDNAGNETGFRIQRAASAGGPWTQIATPGANSTSYSNTGLSASTQYFYRVRAYNGAGNSSWSNTANATTLAPPLTPPTAPSGLTATAVSTSRIDLAWTDNANNEDGFRIERASGGSFSQIATVGANTTSYSNTGLSASTAYSYRVRANNAAGNSSYSNTANATTLSGSVPLPAPWQTEDIGAVGATGDASIAGGTFTIDGSGADIWGTLDEFRYVYQDLRVDGSIVARLVSQGNTNGWAKAGPMIRESLAPNSPHAIMALTPLNGATFDRRTSTGGTTSKTVVAGAAPMWVRLTRVGDLLTGYVSNDGITWTQVDAVTVPMGTDVFIGLAVTSHNDGAISTGVFDNVMVSPGVDTDGDGMADGAEIAEGYDSFSNDQDGNGVADGLDDWDGDGSNNHSELIAGTSPGTPPGGGPGPGPGPGPAPASSGSGSDGGCGLTGLEALALLGLIVGARRRSRAE